MLKRIPIFVVDYSGRKWNNMEMKQVKEAASEKRKKGGRGGEKKIFTCSERNFYIIFVTCI